MRIKNLSELNHSKLNRTVDLIVPAQLAKLSPPVGSTLGQVKIKVKDFCTSFNDSTVSYKKGLPLKVLVFVYKNETFNYIVKPSSTTFLLKNVIALNKKKEITLLDIYKIMIIKKSELEFISEKVIFRNILTLAKIMKIEIKKD